MDISNRSLVLLLILTLMLVGAAAALTVGLTYSTAPPPPDVVATVASDEIRVVPEVIRRGGQKIDPKGPLIVEVAKGTIAPSALLVCDMYKSERPFYQGGMGFETIPFGDCSVKLSGTDHAYSPVYPGDRLICATVDRKTECTGGIAAEKAGVVTIQAAVDGILWVDDEELGPLPLEAQRLKVGRRDLVLKFSDGRYMKWALVVQPEEEIDVYFPWPGDDKAGAATTAAPATVDAAPEVPVIEAVHEEVTPAAAGAAAANPALVGAPVAEIPEPPAPKPQ